LTVGIIAFFFLIQVSSVALSPERSATDITLPPSAASAATDGVV